MLDLFELWFNFNNVEILLSCSKLVLFNNIVISFNVDFGKGGKSSKFDLNFDLNVNEDSAACALEGNHWSTKLHN